MASALNERMEGYDGDNGKKEPAVLFKDSPDTNFPITTTTASSVNQNPPSLGVEENSRRMDATSELKSTYSTIPDLGHKDVVPKGIEDGVIKPDVDKFDSFNHQKQNTKMIPELVNIPEHKPAEFEQPSSLTSNKSSLTMDLGSNYSNPPKVMDEPLLDLIKEDLSGRDIKFDEEVSPKIAVVHHNTGEKIDNAIQMGNFGLDSSTHLGPTSSSSHNTLQSDKKGHNLEPSLHSAPGLDEHGSTQNNLARTSFEQSNILNELNREGADDYLNPFPRQISRDTNTSSNSSILSIPEASNNDPTLVPLVGKQPPTNPVSISNSDNQLRSEYLGNGSELRNRNQKISNDSSSQGTRYKNTINSVPHASESMANSGPVIPSDSGNDQQIQKEDHTNKPLLNNPGGNPPGDGLLIYDSRQSTADDIDLTEPNIGKIEDVVKDDKRNDKSKFESINKNISPEYPVTKKKPSKAPINHDIQIYPDGLDAAINYRNGAAIGIVGVVCYLVGIFGMSFIWMILLAGSCAYYINQKSRIDRDAIDYQVRRYAGVNHLISNDGETVEWLNEFIHHIWRTLDPNLLVSINDIIEDSMNAAMPSFIFSSHVQDLELGTQALRVTSINIFPNTRDDVKDDIFGEISFELHAYPSSNNSKLCPPHITIHLLTGVKGVAEKIIPIKAELLGIAGKARFKINTMSNAPFLRHLDFAFTRVPKFDAGVFPLISLNIMNLPIISSFIHDAINQALQEFVEPKYFPLDLLSLLTGDDQLHDTQAMGVLKIHFKDAFDLIKADIGSPNDVYITCSIQHGKVLCSTRIITDDHPVFNETHFVPVPFTACENDLDLIIEVWDSDKYDKDDRLGDIRFKLKDLVGKGEGNVYFGGADLAKTSKKKKFKGTLNFNIDYCPKYEKKEPVPQEAVSAMLGCLIYQASGVEVVKEEYKSKETGAPDPYCVLYINHEAKFMTRTKLNNPAPYWNATTEYFVKDWANTTVTLVLKTRMSREHDPVIGICNVKLGELFDDFGDKPKEHTQWYALRGGVGFGKIRFGIVIKPIKLDLEEELMGSEIGTLVLDNLALVPSCEAITDKDNLYIHSELITTPSYPQNTSMSSDQYSWDEDQLIFPVKNRYQNSLVVTLKQKTLLKSDKVLGRALISLKRLLDNNIESFEIPLYDKIDGKGRSNSFFEPMEGFNYQPGTIVLKFRIGFFPGLSYAHNDYFKQKLLGLNPKEIVQETNLLWGPPDEEDGNKVGVDDSFSNNSDPNPAIRSSNEGDVLVVEDFDPNAKAAPKISKSSTIRTLKWGKDRMKKKIMDLSFIKSTKSQNQPTIDHEAD